jgi:hypothetical protein
MARTAANATDFPAESRRKKNRFDLSDLICRKLSWFRHSPVERHQQSDHPRSPSIFPFDNAWRRNMNVRKVLSSLFVVAMSVIACGSADAQWAGAGASAYSGPFGSAASANASAMGPGAAFANANAYDTPWGAGAGASATTHSIGAFRPISYANANAHAAPWGSGAAASANAFSSPWGTGASAHATSFGLGVNTANAGAWAGPGGAGASASAASFLPYR